MRSMGEERGGRALAVTSRPLTFPIRLRPSGYSERVPFLSR
jgi:hypothetical protein